MPLTLRKSLNMRISFKVGAKAMYDQGILKRCGTANKPVLLKRGFGSTIQEFVQAAEFILSGGNENGHALRKRNKKLLKQKQRFTLDLCGVSYLKENVNLPVNIGYNPLHGLYPMVCPILPELVWPWELTDF